MSFLYSLYYYIQETVEGEPGLEALLTGMVFTKAGREDNVIVSDLTGKLAKVLVIWQFDG